MRQAAIDPVIIRCFSAQYSLGNATICGHMRFMKSPCINICQIDTKSGLCTGCLRTLDEIASWASYSEAKRNQILAELANRPQPTTEPGVRG